MSVIWSGLQWLLKMFLSGIGIEMRTAEQEEAERQRDAAVLQEQTIEQSKQVEVDIAEGKAKVKEDFDKQKAQRPADDPMGADDWSKGA